MWEEGEVKVKSSIYHYWAKVYDLPSDFGIDQGRVSKLSVRLNDREVFSYDRGWDIIPTTQEEQKVLQRILKRYD